MMTFAILHCDPSPAFQVIAEVHVLYVYVILLFISAWLPRSQAIAICPEGMKKKNIWSTSMSQLFTLV